MQASVSLYAVLRRDGQYRDGQYRDGQYRDERYRDERYHIDIATGDTKIVVAVGVGKHGAMNKPQPRVRSMALHAYHCPATRL